jgi:hypothetical protein
LTSKPAATIFASVVSRITPASNPRIYLIFLMMPASAGAAVAAFYFMGLVPGIVAVVAAFLVCRTLYTFVRRQLASRIETREDGISFNLHGDESVHFAWNNIRLAGTAVEPGRLISRRRLFVYKEEGDVLFLIPDEFENFDGLAAEVRAHTKFNEIDLMRGEDLRGRLKTLLESP